VVQFWLRCSSAWRQRSTKGEPAHSWFHEHLPETLKKYRGWEEYQVVLTYAQLERADEPQRLVPRTIFTEARDRKHDQLSMIALASNRVPEPGVRFRAGATTDPCPKWTCYYSPPKQNMWALPMLTGLHRGEASSDSNGPRLFKREASLVTIR
jgi:hypothetical protein